MLKQLTYKHANEEVIKKSTFIATVAPVTSLQQAIDFIQQNSDVSATHNCWAYRLQDIYRFNDDGEPTGTAGKPILNAIDGQGFDNTVALVIRYYGGIKLGTGGLMRAYGGSVNRCLQSSEFQIIQNLTMINISIPFAYIQSIHNLSKSYTAIIKTENFTETGADLKIEIITDDKSQFIIDATNLCKGRVTVT
ncbi:FIG000605: protein co-occurring with transport systems (COG1739) [hydrothermal vent metagenome]|uniref:FIG000605: protein co-occurring with transport systems (COG1739) n=1 Tax=hydrothermal vent metagenome TaxID=652676 RepID=A0A3B0VMF9_9ZZZZ